MPQSCVCARGAWLAGSLQRAAGQRPQHSRLAALTRHCSRCSQLQKEEPGLVDRSMSFIYFIFYFFFVAVLRQAGKHEKQ